VGVSKQLGSGIGDLFGRPGVFLDLDETRRRGRNHNVDSVVANAVGGTIAVGEEGRGLHLVDNSMASCLEFKRQRSYEMRFGITRRERAAHKIDRRANGYVFRHGNDIRL